MIIAGTGHRPKYCPCKYQDPHPWLDDLRRRLKHSLWAIKPEAVITGMAIGWDTWLAQEALILSIPVHAYVPFKDQGSNWPVAPRKEYERILGESAIIKYISEDYYPNVFFERDRAMVADCDEMFSLLNPEATRGGAFYTVDYAKKQNKKITNFWSTYRD